MKAIYKSLLLTVALAPTLTSCIEEVLPSNVLTEGQVSQSENAVGAYFFGMASFLNNYATITSSNHYDWGYGSLMHIRDVMTGDMAVRAGGYDWYSNWEQNAYQGPDYKYCQFIWNYYNQAVLTTNQTIALIDPENATDNQLAYLGVALAFRANHYLDLARMYEFLPNDKTSPITTMGNDVTGYTVPILTNETSEKDATNNPRVPHSEMFEFIESDLQKAEQYIGYGSFDKTQPNLAVVYGLFARLYMWNLDYAKAAEYARKAINSFSGSPTTKEQWLDTTTGFNTLSTPSWMWGSQMNKEDDVVQSGILNWTSWMSNEYLQGYTTANLDATSPLLSISKDMYDRIDDADFRKLSFIAPAGSPLYGQSPVIDPQFAASFLQPYNSLKFRPGQGNMNDYLVACADAYPLMRIEEMYFIEAEATAHQNPSQGAQLLNTFMQNYRYPTYSCKASGVEAVVEEIVFQKRVELWGEGQTFFDIKRLNYSVTRNYPGTNFYNECAFNTNGRPAWMNICIVVTEQRQNEALVGWNNPDPSDKYEGINAAN